MHEVCVGRVRRNFPPTYQRLRALKRKAQLAPSLTGLLLDPPSRASRGRGLHPGPVILRENRSAPCKQPLLWTKTPVAIGLLSIPRELRLKSYHPL